MKVESPKWFAGWRLDRVRFALAGRLGHRRNRKDEHEKKNESASHIETKLQGDEIVLVSSNVLRYPFIPGELAGNRKR